MSAGLTRFKALLPRGSFARNVAVLAGGTAAGQAIVVLASPILTRLYTPEDFGVLAVYSSLLGILSTVAALRYELAIPLPEKNDDAAALVMLSLSIVVGMSLLAGLGVWLWGDQLAKVFNAQILRPYLWLLPVGMALVGGYQVFNYWAIRKRGFERIARTKLNQGLGNVLSQVVLGILGSGPIGLLVGDIVGRTAGMSTIASGSWKELEGMSTQKIFTIAKRYRRFPLISSFSSLINSAGLQLPSLILSIFYGPQVTGWFLLVQRVMGVPVTLIGQSAAQVYMSEVSRLRQEHSEAMRSLFIKTAQRLFILGAPLILIIGLIGPWVFEIVFGPQWKTAGRFMQMLFTMYLAQFVVYPLSQTLNVLERQELQLLWDVSRLIMGPGILFLGGVLDWQPTITLVLYGFLGVCSYFMLGLLSLIAL